MLFIESDLFVRQSEALLTVDDSRILQSALFENPHLGTLIPGTQGLRKLRYRSPQGNRGKRSGLRVIYYYIDHRNTLYLLTVYSKTQTTNFSNRALMLLARTFMKELS